MKRLRIPMVNISRVQVNDPLRSGLAGPRNKFRQQGYGVKWEVVNFSILFEVKEVCTHELVRFEL